MKAHWTKAAAMAMNDLTEDLRDGELSGYEQDYEKVCEKYKIVYDNVTKIDN